MKRFKINLESFQQPPKPGLTYCGEGLFDFFKKKKEKPKEEKPKEEQEKEPTVEDFEEKLKTATVFSVHLDCDTIKNQIKFLEAYKSKFIPFLYKDIERLSKCFEFIKTKKRTFIDHIDELVDISFPSKMPGYNASKNACIFPEFIIPIKTTKEQLRKKQPDFEFEDGFDNTYPEISDEAEQEKIVKLHMFNTWIYEFSHYDIVHERSKDQEKITLSLDDPLAKKYIELSLEISKEMKKVSEAMDRLRDLGYSAEDSLGIKDYGDGDEFGAGEMFVHGLYMMEETWHFEHRFLRNCKLSKTDIATEAMAIAQEGKIEQIKSFFQRAITTKESMKKAIASLRGKEVKEIFEQEDGGKFSGLKLLDLDKVNGKAIIEYLELVKRETTEAHSLAKRVTDKAASAAKLLEKDIDDKELDNLYSQIYSIENEIEELFDELKKHTATTTKKDKIKIQSASKTEFDKILQLFNDIVESDFLEKIEGYLLKISDYHDLDNKGTDVDKVFSPAQELLTHLFYYLERFDAFEDKFLFSLMKYLQDSTK